MKEQIVIARLGAVYGIKGWLKIHSFTDVAGSIFDYQPWLMEQKGQFKELTISNWRRHNKGLLVKLEGIDQREQAELLTGVEISVHKDQLPDLQDGDYYWRDLIGCSVKNTSNYDFGQVTQMMETGSNDVLMVKANLNDAFGKKERLIPFIEEQVIQSVDLETRTITVDWDPGF
ncbi:ribosome maturation factor RimM [Dongshaea marina]|uniref:ribosome maturation factor RimM n=1 Tax=Dongshaea marina TaxID=2047966 RepID=UPI000D3EB7DF|nr:ribosome maturation factor RimM [Dongshaea marina]